MVRPADNVGPLTRAALAALAARALLVLGLLVAAAPPPVCAAQAPATDASASPGAAKLEQARRAFEAGTAAYNAGRFADALDSFQRAYDLTGNADLLYNVATVADRMRLDERALDAYQGYLAERPNSTDRENVEGRIRALRASIASRVAAERRAEAQAAARSAKAAEAAAKAAREAERARLSKSELVYVPPGKGPFLVMGAGGAAIAVGTTFLLLGRRDRRDVEDAPPFTMWDEVSGAKSRAPRRTATGLALTGAGVAAGLGGLFWHFLGGERVPKAEVAVGAGYVGVRGRF
ncbi:MAG: hypothetical protein KC543_05300 [Myxococcales bacterium]|nr:hypothetical protein [Myxococcales bacterium]